MSRLILDEHVDYLEFMAKCNKENQRFVEAVNETVKFIRDMESKLAHYEDLEEQGRLIEQKHGQWIYEKDEDNTGNAYYHCSICGATDLQHKNIPVPYCWKCGASMTKDAKMDEVE